MSDNPVIKDAELILRASAAATAVVDGTGKAIGPTGLVKAVVVVSALASGGTLDISIQQSSDDAVADAYATIATFPQITAVGTYELPFRATEKYVRYKTTAVHGTESITYEVFVTTVEK
jgi:hypothetical protein